jgi:hypothetical protein
MFLFRLKLMGAVYCTAENCRSGDVTLSHHAMIIITNKKCKM